MKQLRVAYNSLVFVLYFFDQKRIYPRERLRSSHDNNDNDVNDKRNDIKRNFVWIEKKNRGLDWQKEKKTLIS